MEINKGRIAKNTLYLYSRFFLVIIANLYSARIVLEELGASDFGLYNIVYSVVGFLAFLSATLSSSTSRFITYELGSGNIDRLKLTYSTTWLSHAILSIIIVIFAETIGLWYVCKVMVYPPDYFFIVQFVYQISIISTVLSILQIPFTSCVIAHEAMSAFAYIGVLEAILKLSCALSLFYFCGYNKMLIYSLLLLLSSVIVFIIYMYYARSNFLEVSFSLKYDKSILADILKFSAWNILANLCNVITINGLSLLYNLFFSPIVVAAQTVAAQVATGLSQLTNNVRSAVNPQIIKLYANNDHELSMKLTLSSADFLLDLSLITCVPCILLAPVILDIWLVEVPEYAVLFTRIILLQSIVETFNTSYYAPLLASNKIAKNSIIAFVLTISLFVITYLLFILDFGPEWSRYLLLVLSFVLGWIVKPYILYKYVNYPWNLLQKSLLMGCKKIAMVLSVSFLFYYFLPANSTSQLIKMVIINSFIIAFCLYFSYPKNRRLSIRKYFKGLLNKKVIR